MKIAFKVGVSLAVVLGFLVLAQAEEGKEEKLKGTITCAKCDLKKASACHTVVKVKDTIYWFTKDSTDYKSIHKKICTDAKEGTVTGTVTTKDGKKWIKASDVKFN